MSDYCNITVKVIATSVSAQCDIKVKVKPLVAAHCNMKVKVIAIYVSFTPLQYRYYSYNCMYFY